MAGFLNPNVAFDPNNADAFNYDEQMRRLQMQRALAQQLNKPLDQGRMVSGWYTAPSQGAAIASALQQALGGYMSGKTMQSEAELEKADREAMKYGRDLLNKDPQAYIDQARKESPIPEAQYTYKNMDDVGPANPYVAEPHGVPRRGVVSTSLAPTVQPSPGTPPAPVVSGGGGQFQGNGATGSWGDPVQAPVGRGQAQQRANNEAMRQRLLAAEAQAAAAQPPAQAPKQGMAARVQAGRGVPASVPPVPALVEQQITLPDAPQAPVDPNPFNVVQPSAEEVAAATQGQRRIFNRLRQADMKRGVELLENTKSGKPLAHAILAKQYAPAEWDIQKRKNGDEEEVIAINKRDPSDVRLISGTSGKPSVAERNLQQSIAKDKRETVKVWSEQRRVVSERQGQIGAAKTARENIMGAIDLAKDVGIQGIVSQTWAKAKDLIKENPKYAALQFLANEGLLDIAGELKGALSDKDLQFIKDSRPSANSTVQEWLLYAERVLPRLQAAEARAKNLYQSEVSTARELGIPEYLEDESTEAPTSAPTARAAPAAPASGTKLDWRR